MSRSVWEGLPAANLNLSPIRLSHRWEKEEVEGAAFWCSLLHYSYLIRLTQRLKYIYCFSKYFIRVISNVHLRIILYGGGDYVFLVMW